ncbi:LuxR C-terminal-related transcriptional regulator [Cloacibacillus evryensis]|uniref:LuxR C-terminal-related transcriptional regulator n=1 Tax=Cloacibacillus evryensis TaxID=508460 RepID=UPI0026E0CD87|nr:LuxR C-terminal-related transcriptional regulator [Cloacibacillus evryensis]
MRRGVGFKNNDGTYIPPQLIEKLGAMLTSPLTLIEAGSGFGKTTAVAEVLEDVQEQKADVYWHTFLGEPPEKAWQALCGLIAHADGKAAVWLGNLGRPSLSSLPDLASILRDIRCSKTTVIVLDNWQLAGFEISAQLIEALSLHRGKKLHIVVITQPAAAAARTTSNPRMALIGNDSFRYTRENIAEFFLHSRITLDEEQLDMLCDVTEGWIAALRLQLSAYAENGRFETAGGISQLIETAVWNKLTEQEREENLRLSIPKNFTIEQAAAILRRPELSEDEIARLDNDPFVRRDANEGTYTFHSLKRAYLADKLSRRSREYQLDALRRAAEGYAARGDVGAAASCYARTRDYEAIFALPFGDAALSQSIRYARGESIDAIFYDCPKEILLRHPEIMLRAALEFFLKGDFEHFSRAFALAEKSCELEERRGGERAINLRGELEFLKFFPAFNDVKAMCAAHEKAWKILRGPLKTLYFNDDTWTFGISSVVCMFWRESGSLREELKEVENGMPCYYKLRNGHGMGAPAAMAAETALMSGDDESAQNLAIKAIYSAEIKHQDSICFCGELVLARIAALRGESGKFSKTLAEMRARAFEGRDPYGVVTAELCRAHLGTMAGIGGLIPEWTLDARRIREKVFAAAVPFALIPLAKYLLDNDPVSFGALVGEFIDESRRFHMLLPEIYFRLYAVRHKQRSGENGEAETELNAALDLALPDKIYLPFAEQGSEIAPLLVALRPQIGDKQAVDAILALSQRLQYNISGIPDAGTQPGDKPLSAREREVARLLAEGLTTQEAAERLSITNNTVCTMKKSVYKKLKVRSRVELAKRCLL